MVCNCDLVLSYLYISVGPKRDQVLRRESDEQEKNGSVWRWIAWAYVGALQSVKKTHRSRCESAALRG
jgi:hypothetical protein